MDACKAAIADSEKKDGIESWKQLLKQPLKPQFLSLDQTEKVKTGTRHAGTGAMLSGIDDAQRLNNMFASKGSLRKAGLELAAAAKRMGSLTADITHSDPEEAEQL